MWKRTKKALRRGGPRRESVDSLAPPPATARRQNANLLEKAKLGALTRAQKSVESSVVNLFRSYKITNTNIRFGAHEEDKPLGFKEKAFSFVFKNQETIIKVSALVCGILATAFFLRHPFIATNVIIGCFLPLFGTLQVVLGMNLNSLMASESHWRMYWAVYFLWLIMDFTFLLPFIFLAPKIYCAGKSATLVALSLPTTTRLVSLRSFLQDDELFMGFCKSATDLYEQISRWFEDSDKEIRERSIFMAATAVFSGLSLFCEQFGLRIGSLRGGIANSKLDFREIRPGETSLQWKERTQKQAKIVAEFVATEREYYFKLVNIESFLAAPVLNEQITMSDPDVGLVLKTFFKLWEDVTNVHHALLSSLEAAVFKDELENPSTEPKFSSMENVLQMKSVLQNESIADVEKLLRLDSVNKLAGVLERKMETVLPHLYKSFCGNYRLACVIFKTELNKNELLQENVKMCKDAVNMGIEGQLVQPVQRLFRYPLLLKELMKTISDGSTKMRINQFLASLEQLTYQADNEAFRAENLLKMAEINDRLRYSKKVLSSKSSKAKNEKRNRYSRKSSVASMADFVPDVSNITLMDPEHRIIYTSIFPAHKGSAFMGNVHVFFEIERKNKQKTIYKRSLQPILFNDLLLLVVIKKAKKKTMGGLRRNSVSKGSDDKLYFVKYLLPLMSCNLTGSAANYESVFPAKKSSISFRGNFKDVSLIEQIKEGRMFPITLENPNWKKDGKNKVRKVTMCFDDNTQRKFWEKNFIDALQYSNTHIESTYDVFENIPFADDVFFGADVASLAGSFSTDLESRTDYEMNSSFGEEDHEDDMEIIQKLGGIRAKAAVLVQSQFRGIVSRRQYQERRNIMLKATTLIQNNFRKARAKS